MAVEIRKDPKAGWWIEVEHDGKQVREWVRYKQRALDLKRKIEEKLATREEESTPPMEMSFEVRAALYADRYIKPTRESSTYDRYKQLLRDYINPVMGWKDIREIRRGDIRDLLLSIKDAGLSGSTIGLVKDVISGVFNYTKDDELIKSNPCDGILKNLGIGRAQKSPDPLSRSELDLFLSTCKDHFPEHYPMFMAAFRTGLRRGEFLALEWGDVDWDDRTIHVQRKIYRGKVGKLKTIRSNRRVDISEGLYPVLRELHAERKREALEAGTGKVVPIIFHKRGRHIPQTSAALILQKIREKAGLRKFSFHATRHTYGSLLASDGTPLNYIMEQMGHTSIEMTVNRYGRYQPRNGPAEVNRLERPSLVDTPEAVEGKENGETPLK